MHSKSCLSQTFRKWPQPICRMRHNKNTFYKTTSWIQTPPSSSLIKFLNLELILIVYNQSACANEYQVRNPKCRKVTEHRQKTEDMTGSSKVLLLLPQTTPHYLGHLSNSCHVHIYPHLLCIHLPAMCPSPLQYDIFPNPLISLQHSSFISLPKSSLGCHQLLSTPFSQTSNHTTNFHNKRCECYTTTSHPSIIHFNSLQLVTTLWQMHVLKQTILAPLGMQL